MTAAILGYVAGVLVGWVVRASNQPETTPPEPPRQLIVPIGDGYVQMVPDDDRAELLEIVRDAREQIAKMEAERAAMLAGQKDPTTPAPAAP